jgi:hypothetical protein
VDTLVNSPQDSIPVHSVNGMGCTALGNVAMQGQLDVVKVLPGHGVTEEVATENSLLEMEALLRACAGDHLEVAKALMAAGFADNEGSRSCDVICGANPAKPTDYGTKRHIASMAEQVRDLDLVFSAY